jgi:CHAT domain-containing protein
MQNLTLENLSNLTYIQFWGDERIKLNKIEKLKLEQPAVDLLVLSACITADLDDFKSLFKEILNREILNFAGVTHAVGLF